MSIRTESPFQFGKTVGNTLFVNREAEKKKLITNFKSGVNTIIISPRRWGKSSLVLETARIIKESETDIRICFVDAFSILSEEEFFETLARELIKCTSNQVEDWLRVGKDFFKALVPRFSYGLDPQNDFTVSLDWKELQKHRNEILDLPETIAQKKGVKIVVCIDEFQNVRNFANPDTFEKVVRSRWQHHQHVSYCLYGSKRHMMSEIFNEKNRPFYRFGEIIMLRKIEKSHWVEYLINAFLRTGKSLASPLAETLVDLMKCHSYYVQQLAHLVWSLTEETTDESIVQKAIDELLSHNDALYEREIEGLSITQINFLKAVLDGVAQFTSAKVMQDYRLGTPRNVSKNKETLRNQDFIDIRQGKGEFLDPAFELWFKKVYSGKKV